MSVLYKDFLRTAQ